MFSGRFRWAYFNLYSPRCDGGKAHVADDGARADFGKDGHARNPGLVVAPSVPAKPCVHRIPAAVECLNWIVVGGFSSATLASCSRGRVGMVPPSEVRSPTLRIFSNEPPGS